MDYKPQVPKEHYFRCGYIERDRWMNYFIQLQTIIDLKPETVLEIGIGNGIVGNTLRKLGVKVTTLDVAGDLKPDIVASVTKMPLADKSFDAVLAAEILEHIPWEELPKAMREIHRVSKKYAVLTLPHSGYTFSFSWKVPLLPTQRWIFKIPHFWKKHVFSGEHYWEMGKSGFPVRRIKKLLQDSGFKILKAKTDPEDPAHWAFLLAKSRIYGII
jgi:ubiquinone/menaquinone biosynthesis C-methylase UbiE